MRRHAALGASAVGALLAGVLTATVLPTTATGSGPLPAEPATSSPQQRAVPQRPNLVVFLTDDLDESLLRHMPATRRHVVRRGARFANHFTNVSLCCPSRASLFTGKYAHNTGVDGNEYPDGFWGFHEGDERRRTFAVWLREAGYRTSLLGKYLNEYPFVESAPRHAVQRTFVPRGWSDWAVPIRGQYYGTDYLLNLDGRIVHKSRPRDYLGDLMARRAVRQVRNAQHGRPLLVELSYYGPHRPEPASPIERNDERLAQRLRDLDYPRTPAFDERDVSDKPRFVRALPRLDRATKRYYDRVFRRRVLSATSIDRTVLAVVRALRATGQLDETYLVFTSDNGWHAGEHRMPEGKNTPYDEDIAVPFAIRGPGIEPGTVVHHVTGTIDLAPTLADLAGVEVATSVDGESLLPLARGREVGAWRDHLYVQRGLVTRDGRIAPRGGEPASFRERQMATTVPGYEAAVSRRWRYVEYRYGFRELYDVRRDPHQLRNLLAVPAEERSERVRSAAARMRDALDRLRGCRGVEACRVQTPDVP